MDLENSIAGPDEQVGQEDVSSAQGPGANSVALRLRGRWRHKAGGMRCVIANGVPLIQWRLHALSLSISFSPLSSCFSCAGFAGPDVLLPLLSSSRHLAIELFALRACGSGGVQKLSPAAPPHLYRIEPRLQVIDSSAQGTLAPYPRDGTSIGVTCCSSSDSDCKDHRFQRASHQALRGAAVQISEAVISPLSSSALYLLHILGVSFSTSPLLLPHQPRSQHSSPHPGIRGFACSSWPSLQPMDTFPTSYLTMSSAPPSESRLHSQHT